MSVGRDSGYFASIGKRRHSSFSASVYGPLAWEQKRMTVVLELARQQVEAD